MKAPRKAAVWLDASPPRSGKTRRAIRSLKEDEPSLFVSPVIGTPGAGDFGDTLHGWKPTFVGWFGHDKMCGGNCTKARAASAKLVEEQAQLAEARGFWVPEWKACLASRPPVCPVRVGLEVAESGRGHVLTTMQKLAHPPERNRESLEDFAAAIARGRNVVIDEIHRWDTWTQLKACSATSPALPAYGHRFIRKEDESDDYLETLDQWLSGHARAAARLYGLRDERLPRLQKERFKLLREDIHRLALFPDGLTLNDLDKELAEVAAKKSKWRPDQQTAPRSLRQQLETVLAASQIGEIATLATPRLTTVRIGGRKRDVITGWDFEFSASDIESTVVQGRLMRVPRFTVLRAILGSARKVTLLSATPPPEGEIRYAVQKKVRHRSLLRGPGLNILLERSTRGQEHTTFQEQRFERHAAGELIIPVVKHGNGILFLRSKREYDHVVWKKLPVARLAYCRGTESLGKQNQDASFVALAGPPHLPVAYEPFCVIDPVDTGHPEADNRRARAVASQMRTLLMMQEVFQASSRTGSVDKKQPAKAVVFGCSKHALREIMKDTNHPPWARVQKVNIAILPGRGSTGYDARRLAIRAWLEGIDLAYKTPPKQPPGGPERAFISPAVVEEWYWILAAIKRGKLKNGFSTREYQDLRSRHRYGRSKNLGYIVNNWVPRSRANHVPLVRQKDGWPTRYWFVTKPLKGAWNVEKELGRERRIRTKKRA